MDDSQHRTFRPSSPVTALEGNAWEAWNRDEHAREHRNFPTTGATPALSTTDWLDGVLGSFGPDGPRR